MVALVVLACTVTAALGLAISTAFVAQGSDAVARTRLARLADLAATAGPTAGDGQDHAVLGALRIRVVRIDASGRTSSGSPAVAGAVVAGTVRSVLAGSPVSTTSEVTGHQVLVEARPWSDGGGVALVERETDADAAGRADLVRTLWALTIALLVTVAIGTFAIRRVLRPLRRTAEAAQLLAGGRRDVFVSTDAPTEIAEVADALNGLTAALVHSEGRQREFLLSVSHDLRTPLTAIVGYAESLRTGVVAGRDAREFVVGIEQEAHRLEVMVADLLDLSRLQAEDVRVDLQPVDLTALVDLTGRAWSTRCDAAGLRLVLVAPPWPVWGTTDPGRLRQVLDCLLDNAVRVGPAGAPVVLELRPLDPATTSWAAVVEVRDGGPGLTDDDLTVAFERGRLHQRYRGVRPVGSGLGLAIVGRLAARLGIGLEPGHAVEGGARFTLFVPPP